MRQTLLALCVALTTALAHADEGMWIPMLIGKKMADMQKQGCRLSTEDIYAVNQASLKDAVAIFGGGCSSVIVSNEGLLLTNYHCGHDAIQKLSSAQSNYLNSGFWAMSRDEELPCIGLEVKVLQYIEDVTDYMLQGTEKLSQDEYGRTIEQRTAIMEQDSTQNSPGVVAVVEPFYGGNQYLKYVYKVYTDVRLVGAPPRTIGKFGGDTDNWMWPRHTGDFSVFRIYADEHNEPAEFNTANRPFKPVRHIKTSTKGVDDEDFSMVIGYPGSTKLYMPSNYVKIVQDILDPMRVEIRTAKLDVINKHMATSEAIRLQYAAKHDHTSNAWKKWQAEAEGLRKHHAYDRIAAREKQLSAKSRKTAGIIRQYGKLYDSKYASYLVTRHYIYEMVHYGGIEIFGLVKKHRKQGTDKDFFSEIDTNLAQEMAEKMLGVYCRNVDRRFWPKRLADGTETPGTMAKRLYDTSDSADNYGSALQLYNEFVSLLREAHDFYLPDNFNSKEAELSRRYQKAIAEAYPDSLLPPDANFTMRVSYGKTRGYDGPNSYFTTLDQVIEKSHQDNPDYQIPTRLEELYRQNDYSEYADHRDGKMHVCFTTTTHTTGGNSGSPQLNADGELTGLNFDSAWDGVLTDLIYSDELQRNIVVDIRYVMFIIDKFGGAKHIVDEMLGRNTNNEE